MFFDGKVEAKKLNEKIKAHLPVRGSRGEDGKLGIVLIGSNPASQKYVGLKTGVCEKIGVDYEVFKLDETEKNEQVIAKSKEFILRDDITGAIVQLPLSNKSLLSILDTIPIEKDIDVLSRKTRELSFSGELAWESPVVRAFEHFVNFNKINLKACNTVIIGSGFLVGEPVSNWLMRKEVKVTVLDESSPKVNLKDFDLVVLATGTRNLVKGEDLKSNSYVIDFGYPGDLDLNSDLAHLKSVSPAIGGMGPLVIRYLIMNHLKLSVL